MTRPRLTTTLFVIMLFGGMSVVLAQTPPSATAKCGPVGDPPTKGWVRVDGTWDNCGTSNDFKAEVKLYRKTPSPVTLVYTNSAEPVGGKGTLGGDVQSNKQFQSGDTVYAVTKVYDKSGTLIVEKQSADYTVP
jgi:hypothetical protein